MPESSSGCLKVKSTRPYTRRLVLPSSRFTYAVFSISVEINLEALVNIKPVLIVLSLYLLIACSTTSPASLVSLSDMTLCDNALNYNGRSPALQNARTEELDKRAQDCSAYAHLKRGNLEISERPNQKRRRRPFGKDFPR